MAATPFDRLAEAMLRVAAPLVPKPATLDLLVRGSDVREVARGGHLLRQGEVAEHVHYVWRGLFRFCSVDSGNGEERTLQFFDEARFFTEPGSFFGRTPSGLAIEAVEDSAVLRLPRAVLEAAYAADHAVERFGRLMVEDALTGAQRRSTNLLTLDPEERYRTFVATRPEVARRLPQYLIASYLGITPEALSRIRGRVARRSTG